MRKLTIEQLQKKVFTHMDEVEQEMQRHQHQIRKVLGFGGTVKKLGRTYTITTYWCPEHEVEESVLFYRDGEIVNLTHGGKGE